MNTQHTPGPWRQQQGPNGYLYIRGACGSVVATMSGTNALAYGTEKANAALIAAAPDLLAALESILGAHDTKNNGAYMGEAVLCHHYAETAREAIRMARYGHDG